MIRRPSTILTTSTRYTFSTDEIYEIKDYDDDEEEDGHTNQAADNQVGERIGMEGGGS